MAKRKGKSISFDAMVKFFMQNYNIPTKKDVDRITAKLDNLEKMMKPLVTYSRNRRIYDGYGRAKLIGRPAMTASETVLQIIKKSKKGVGFSDIQAKTGFEDKKIRNIIYRLDKLEKITRKRRGLYVSV